MPRQGRSTLLWAALGAGAATLLVAVFTSLSPIRFDIKTLAPMLPPVDAGHLGLDVVLVTKSNAGPLNHYADYELDFLTFHQPRSRKSLVSGSSHSSIWVLRSSGICRIRPSFGAGSSRQRS